MSGSYNQPKSLAQNLIDQVGIQAIIDCVGRDAIARAVRELIDEKGMGWFVLQLSAEQVEEMKRILEQYAVDQPAYVAAKAAMIDCNSPDSHEAQFGVVGRDQESSK